jgi:hypothetical protein
MKCAILVLFLVQLACYQALVVNGATGVLAYFRNCPSRDWTNLNTHSSYRGRVIKGAANNQAGTTRDYALSSRENQHGHSHGGWQMRTSFGSRGDPYVIFEAASNGDHDAMNPNTNYYVGSGNAQLSSSKDLPMVTLSLCSYTGSSSFSLPTGIVVYLKKEAQSCPSGMADFTDAHGRFLVFAEPAKNPRVTGKSPASVCGHNSGCGSHTHSMNNLGWNSQPTYPSNAVSHCKGSGASSYGSHTWAQHSAPASEDLNIPVRFKYSFNTTLIG